MTHEPLPDTAARIRARSLGAHYDPVERRELDWDAALFPVAVLLVILLVVLFGAPPPAG